MLISHLKLESFINSKLLTKMQGNKLALFLKLTKPIELTLIFNFDINFKYLYLFNQSLIQFILTFKKQSITNIKYKFNKLKFINLNILFNIGVNTNTPNIKPNNLLNNNSYIVFLCHTYKVL